MQRTTRKLFLTLLGFVTLLAATITSGEAAPKKKPAPPKKVKPSITITKVPPATLTPGPDAIGVIAGEVKGVTGAEAKVVLFAKGGEIYYVQPFVGLSDTEIVNGTWRSDTHGGTEYVALLCKLAYNPPESTGVLPAVGGQILAIAKARPK